jgi:phospholipid/cholesterol/gamma-HCH transport system ATP-binding protein
MLFRRTRSIPEEYLQGRGAHDDLLRALFVMTQFDGRTVLDGVDLAIRRGEIFVILGPSGCGKTTLLRHMAGMLPPTMGSIQIEGKDIYSMPAADLDELRTRMGFSFQHGALLNSMSVLDNVCLPLREATRLPEDLIRDIGCMKLDMVGLADARHLNPADLSGGMKKRAAIARAIALDPDLVFFDEPSAGLDPITAAEIDNLILKLKTVFGITMVVVTHDIPSAFMIADHMILLLGGRQLAKGSPDDVLSNKDPHVVNFVGRMMPENDPEGVDILNYTPNTGSMPHDLQGKNA